jgi:hypothetical protein
VVRDLRKKKKATFFEVGILWNVRKQYGGCAKVTFGCHLVVIINERKDVIV